MDIDSFAAFASFIAALSVGTERLTQIVKNTCSCLHEEQPDSKREGWRKATVQIIAIACGIFTAWLVSLLVDNSVTVLNGMIETDQALVLHNSVVASIRAMLGNPIGIVVLGILSSGGSAFWNPVVEYLRYVKDMKKKEANQ